MKPGTEAATEEDQVPVYTALETAEERLTARDTYIEASGEGTAKIGPYVISTSDGDVLKLVGGETGATFYGFLFWSKPKIAVNILDDHQRLSEAEARAYAAWDEATTETYSALFEALEEIRKEMKDRYDIRSILEIDNISLKPGETFTITNHEDYYADKYWTERKGFIQWSMGFKVVGTGYNASLDENRQFGEEIEQKVKVKGLATTFYQWTRPGQPPPEDFWIAPEEEGGFQEETGGALLDPLKDLFGDFGERLAPYVSAAMIILAAVAAVVFLFVFRAPLTAGAGIITGYLEEVTER